MPTFHARSNIADVVSQDDARELVRGLIPEVLASPLATAEASFPLAAILELIAPGDPRNEQLLDALGEIEDRAPRPPLGEPIVPRADYEADTVERGTAPVMVPEDAQVRRMAEIEITGPSHGNPFVDVDLTAIFSLEDHELRVGGFYDGDGRYLVRFLPPRAGRWSFRTTSNARSLDGIDGLIDIADSDARGAVHADGMHFSYDDGTPYVPLGTTAYAWTHQEQAAHGPVPEALPLQRERA
jgi:hypothetical protein